MTGCRERTQARLTRAGVATLALAALALLLALPGPASAAKNGPTYAPLDRPGPKLRVDRDKLRNSVDCFGGVRNATRAPVLLVPATGVNSEQNYSWNYQPLFEMEGIPHCTSNQPGARNSNRTDIQVRGEYLTYAIRKMHRMAGRRISIVGHSQGGMAMRWPLRFWPDTRRMVDDVVGAAGTNRGTDVAKIGCSDEDPEDCSPASEQQSSDSNFIKALNSRVETFRSISYTEIFTEADETVRPPRFASSVSGPGKIRNVEVHEVCPNSTSDHLELGTVDPGAAALTLDALTHPGPAKPSRVSPTVCAALYQPGVDEQEAPAQIASAIQALYFEEGPIGPEPQLRCYVFEARKACLKQRRQSD